MNDAKSHNMHVSIHIALKLLWLRPNGGSKMLGFGIQYGMAGAPHILVVEDNQDIREVLAEVLEAEGCRVSMAIDGLDGINKLRALGKDLPNLILLDLMMPGHDGYDF